MMINEAHAQATAASGRGDGQYPSGLHDGAEISTAAGGQTKAEVPLTMEAVITRENLMLAYQRVVENKGVAELKPWLKKNWRSVWQVLIDGNYQPRAIRRMDIPKPDGYPEAGWRRENLRHPDGGGQAYPAGDSAAVKRHRGHSFCRYADDCNIYVSSRKAGDHLLKDIRAFVESKLKQKVNEKKSAVARPWERKLWADSDGPCCFTKRLGRQAELGSLRT